MKKNGSRIMRYDRLQAIQRTPEFIAEYREYKELIKLKDSAPEELRSQAGDRAAQKGIELELKWGAHPTEIMHANKFKGRPKCVEVVETISTFEKPIYKVGTNNVEALSGDRLYLKVNIRDTKENLLENFKRIIYEYKELLSEEPSKKNRGTRFDPWKIYDMYKKEPNFSRIAKKLSGINENPSYNSVVKKYYKAVKNAYKQACQMIELVSK